MRVLQDLRNDLKQEIWNFQNNSELHKQPQILNNSHVSMLRISLQNTRAVDPSKKTCHCLPHCSPRPLWRTAPRTREDHLLVVVASEPTSASNVDEVPSRQSPPASFLEFLGIRPGAAQNHHVNMSCLLKWFDVNISKYKPPIHRPTKTHLLRWFLAPTQHELIIDESPNLPSITPTLDQVCQLGMVIRSIM